MTARSTRKELGQSYELVFAADVDAFLAQVIGARQVRVVAVESGGAAPADDSVDYFVLSSAVGGTNAIGRPGLEGADIYMRSNQDTADAKSLVTHCPTA